MKTYKVHEAKTNLSKILQLVEDGETVYIARGKQVVAEIKATTGKKKPFPFGLYEGQFELADSWDSEETNKEIADSINNSPLFPET